MDFTIFTISYAREPRRDRLGAHPGRESPRGGGVGESVKRIHCNVHHSAPRSRRGTQKTPRPNLPQESPIACSVLPAGYAKLSGPDPTGLGSRHTDQAVAITRFLRMMTADA